MFRIAAYVNFSFGTPTLTLTLVIWGLCAGLFLASCASVYNKYYLGGAIRGLVASGCVTADGALTLSEAGVKPSAAMRRALRDGKALRRYITVANPEECRTAPKTGGFVMSLRRFFTGEKEPPASYDLAKARLFVPEDKRIQAELRYDKKGSSPWLLAVAFVLFALLAAVLTVSLPKLLDFTDSMITMYKNLR